MTKTYTREDFVRWGREGGKKGVGKSKQRPASHYRKLANAKKKKALASQDPCE